MSNLSQFTGYIGSKGDVGYTGSQGGQGNIGYTGSRGDQGVQGYTGSIGTAGDAGIQGNIGYTGSQGTIGYTGSLGTAGDAGIQGNIGYTGSRGAQGVAITLKGTVAAVVNLPDTANTINDAYIVTADGNLYVWDGAVWNDVGQIVGPEGPIGYTGSASTVAGYTGSQGAVGYSGSKGDIGYTGSASTVAGYTGSQGVESTQPVVVVTGTTQLATSGTLYALTNTTDPTTLTLPGNPAAGDRVSVSNATTRTDATISRNTSPIMGIAQDLVIDYVGATVKLCYIDATVGWFLV